MCKGPGVGVDLCAVGRMAPQLEKEHFLSRCFTPDEIAYIRSRGANAAQTLAGFWAAKEAVLKALGVGIIAPMTEVEISHDEHGAPVCTLHGSTAALAEGARPQLSIAHEGDMAIAFCVLREG